MAAKYLLAIDAGTTSNRVALLDKEGSILRMVQQELHQSFPHDGWVEEDGMEIWQIVLELIREIMRTADLQDSDIAAIGMANQRETTLVWSRESGKPVYPAIVWQCRRTADYCEELKAQGLSPLIQAKTGLVIDAYFSATKLRWILDHVPGARAEAEAGKLCFGTVDSWLLWNLSGGQAHATDHSNASRTMLYNLHEADWDGELLELFDIPAAMLPRLVDHDQFVGETAAELFGSPIPLAPALGDQQAALFGQLCLEPGSSKNTYGTGGFLLVNTGSQAVIDDKGLLTTVAWRTGGANTYALEGSVFIAGGAVKWLRDKMQLIESAGASDALARSVPDTGGCYMVPAFSGLGAPHWDPYARGLLIGMTQDTSRAHVVRATLESIVYQTEDILAMIKRAAPESVQTLRVDGGAAKNDFLLQFQADISNLTVERSENVESTVTGAAYMAGLLSGFWPDLAAIRALAQDRSFFRPRMAEAEREKLLHGWSRAVERARGWVEI